MKRVTPRIEPLLYFDRQCEQAIELYKKAFGAQVVYFQRFADVSDNENLPDYDHDRDSQLIYHAQLRIGEQRILLCDNLFNDLARGYTVSLVVMFDNVKELEPVYRKLAEGATIIDPSDNGTTGGPIIDRYGIHWDLIVYLD